MSSDLTLLVIVCSVLGVVIFCVFSAVVYFCYKSRYQEKSESSYTDSKEGRSTFSPDIKMRNSLQVERGLFSHPSKRSLSFRHCPSVTTLESNRAFDYENSESISDGEFEEKSDSATLGDCRGEEKGMISQHDEMLAMRRALKTRLERKRQSIQSIDQNCYQPSLHSHGELSLESQDIVLY